MDLKLIQTGDGAELIKNSNDLAVIFGFQNMPLLAMFGGNVKASTPILRLPTEQGFDWWANKLLMEGDSSIQFNSETERALNEVPLTSSGRTLIQQAVEKDLAFMKEFATVIVVVTIPATDKVAIGIRLVQPDNLEAQDFIYIWDATNSELMADDQYTVTVSQNRDRIFDFTFDVSFE